MLMGSITRAFNDCVILPKCVYAGLMLMPNNQNELAFQLWWFAYYDHGCACVPHTFSLGLKMTTSYSMFLADNGLWRVKNSVQEI
jgi:hypothetical protein